MESNIVMNKKSNEFLVLILYSKYLNITRMVSNSTIGNRSTKPLVLLFAFKIIILIWLNEVWFLVLTCSVQDSNGFFVFSDL